MTEFQKELEHGVKETRKKCGVRGCTGEMASFFCTHTWKKQPQACLTYRPGDVRGDMAIRGHWDVSGGLLANRSPQQSGVVAEAVRHPESIQQLGQGSDD